MVPDRETAERNYIQIFNSIQAAGRQWGSAIYHNGLSFFPVVVPKGTLLYHGSQSRDLPPGPEWMAFEVEHAEAFAFSAKKKNGEDDDQSDVKARHSLDQKPITLPINQPKGSSAYFRGYLHTYRAHRDLNVLYVDGMSAGKSFMGTLDTQDLVLRENNTSETWGPFMDEIERAESICQLLTQLKYDGLMRMEMGFELIYCDFANGVDRIMMTRSAIHDEKSFESNMNPFQWARAAAERYDGIGGDRARLDFSSMVSAYFFPVNISNTDPDRPDLHRLANANLEDLKDINRHLQGILKAPRRFKVNWQAVVDMIVARYSHRLALLASPEQPLEVFSNELEIATQAYVNAPPRNGDISVQENPNANLTTDALLACKQHYLLPTYLDRDSSWGLEDHLIHAAIYRVTTHICDTFFNARAIMVDDHDDHNRSLGGLANHDKRLDKLTAARHLFVTLKQTLAWSTWRKPEICAADELLLTVMWPLGTSDDYWKPGCRTYDQVNFARHGYWKPDFEIY